MPRGRKLKRSVRSRRAAERDKRRALAHRRKRTKQIGRKEGRSPRWRRSRRLLRKVLNATKLAHRRRVVAEKRLANYREQLAAERVQPGKLVLAAAATQLGHHETGSNDAPWLRSMEADLQRAGSGVGWVIPGQPYCGFGVLWSVLRGLAFRLPDGMVYTPNIAGYAGLRFKARDGKRYKLVRVSPEHAKPGAIVVFDWVPGTGADHTGLARGPMRGGVIPTREFNTSPGSSGSQSNGGGVYDRLRYRANVLAVLNIERA